jgi:hypothetical protein
MKKRRKERYITARKVRYWKEYYIFRNRLSLEKNPCLVTMKEGVLKETINCPLCNEKYEELLT